MADDRKHYMLPVDDTEESYRAYQWLIQNLYKEGEIIDIVHVVPQSDVGAPVWLGVYDQLIITEQDHTEEHVKSALDMIQSKFGAALTGSKVQYRVHVLRGTTSTGGIADAIADKAEKLGSAAIVMAHHHKSTLQTWFLGSVCLDIVNRAKMPLVIIR